LLVHGENDPVIRQPDLIQDKRHYVISFDQSGHFPMLDEGSKFNRLLIDFLSMKSGVNLNQLQVKEEWKRRVR
jgi:pimeloyl-ACP methyl ester carboxylesterase